MGEDGTLIREKLLNVFQDTFRVLYSPVKAFRKIAENPDSKGPILILILILLATTGVRYVSLTKTFLEIPLLDPPRLIPPDPPYEIPINFTIPEFPRNISVITLNWTSGSYVVTVHGTNANGHTYAEEITIKEDTKTYYTHKPFQTVTKIAFSNGGDNSTQFVTLGMTPGEYESPLQEYPMTDLISSWFIPALLNRAIGFFLDWAIYTGILLVVLTASREEPESWAALLTVVGYIFAATLVHTLASTLLVSPLPRVEFPLEARIMGDPELINRIYQETWGAVFYVLNYLPYAIDVWMAALCALAIYFLYKLPWKKAAAFSAITFIVNFLFRHFLGILPELIAVGGLLAFLHFIKSRR